MAKITKLTLPNNRAVYVEAEEVKPSGPQDLSSGDDKSIAEEAFDVVSSTLAEVASNLEQHLSEFGAKGPQKVVVEIHAEIKGGGSVFIVSGEAKGGLKVQLTWDRGA